MTLLRFIIYYHGFGMIVACLALALQFVMGDTVILSPHFWMLFVVIFIITFIAYAVSDIGVRKGGEVSIYSLIGGLFIKLFASLAIAAVLIVKFPEYKMLTALNFFSLYFLFTAFEITCLLRNLRDQNQM